jgi:hypothetical protein
LPSHDAARETIERRLGQGGHRRSQRQSRRSSASAVDFLWQWLSSPDARRHDRRSR